MRAHSENWIGETVANSTPAQLLKFTNCVRPSPAVGPPYLIENKG